MFMLYLQCKHSKSSKCTFAKSVQYLPYFVNVYNIYCFLCIYNINLHYTILPYNVKKENFSEVSHSLAIIEREGMKEIKRHGSTIGNFHFHMNNSTENTG